ncbi:MAG: hypothetical protein H6719_08890 [Sandaracinaceae bacterium]|nr:hypothetical protein [Sandaracinaceae bacterium]
MATWPFWILFLSAGALALVVVKRFDDVERRSHRQRRSDSKPDLPKEQT